MVNLDMYFINKTTLVGFFEEYVQLMTNQVTRLPSLPIYEINEAHQATGKDFWNARWEKYGHLWCSLNFKYDAETPISIENIISVLNRRVSYLNFVENKQYSQLDTKIIEGIYNQTMTSDDKKTLVGSEETKTTSEGG